MLEGNVEYLVGAILCAGAVIYFLWRFVDDIHNCRVDSFWDAAVSVALILISIGIAIFSLASYIDSLPSRCDNCGGAIDTKYCTSCGALAETPEPEYVCEDCGKTIDTEYCGDCGGKKVPVADIEIAP
jgi:hypothetical protein